MVTTLRYKKIQAEMFYFNLNFYPFIGKKQWGAINERNQTMHETTLQLKTWEIMLRANATSNLFNVMKGATNTNSLVLPDL